MFDGIRNLENIKWDFVSEEFSKEIANFTEIEKKLDQKIPQTPQYFYAVE